MKSKIGLLGLSGLLIVVFVVILFLNTAVYAKKGVIKYPVFKSQHVSDTTRDMVVDLGWRVISEKGTTINGKTTLVFTAQDHNKTLITFTFDLNYVASSVEIAAAAGSQYTLEEITNELGRRLGESTGSVLLPVE